MIGVFGGTFNPIHFGHLRSALELVDVLRLQQLRIIPCGLPPHREAPNVGAQERLAMVRVAVASEPAFIVDEREINRAGPSFSIDTLRSLRGEFPQQPIALIIGSDSFRAFDTWHQWQSITELAHVVVVQRPGKYKDDREGLSAELQAFVDAHLTDTVLALHKKPCGYIFRQAITQLDISATQIRNLVNAGKSARYLVPDGVWDLIRENRFYQYGTS